MYTSDCCPWMLNMQYNNLQYLCLVQYHTNKPQGKKGGKKQHQVTTNSSPSKERDQSSALWCGFSQRGGVTQNHCSQRLGTTTLSFSLLSWPSRLQGSPALGNSTCSLCAGYVPQDPAQRGNCPPLKWKLKSLQNKCSDSSGSKGSL